MIPLYILTDLWIILLVNSLRICEAMVQSHRFAFYSILIFLNTSSQIMKINKFIIWCTISLWEDVVKFDAKWMNICKIVIDIFKHVFWVDSHRKLVMGYHGWHEYRPSWYASKAQIDINGSRRLG